MADQHELDSIATYALDLLDDAERARVEAHLRECAGCARELSQHRATLDLLPDALATAQAPGSAWQAIESRIRRGEVHERAGAGWLGSIFARPFVQPALLAILVAAVLGLIGWNASLQARLSDRTSALDTVVSQWQSSGSPPTVVALVAKPGARDAGGRLVMSQDRREGGLVVAGLPALPEGQSYQIWFVRSDQSRAPANTFAVDSHGQAVFLVDVPQPADGFDAVAISEEPRGGSPTPTTPDVLAGLIYGRDAGS